MGLILRHLFRHILPLAESGRNLYEAVKDGKHYHSVTNLVFEIIFYIGVTNVENN